MNTLKKAFTAATASRRGQSIWRYVILATLIAGVTLPGRRGSHHCAQHTPLCIDGQESGHGRSDPDARSEHLAEPA